MLKEAYDFVCACVYSLIDCVYYLTLHSDTGMVVDLLICRYTAHAPWDSAGGYWACGLTLATRRGRARALKQKRQLRGGLADQPRQRLSQGADGLLSKARLPPFFDDAEQLTICILGLSTLRGEASDLRPTAGPLSVDHGRLQLKCGATPQRFAGHEHARGDAYVHRARAVGEGSGLFDPASDEGQAVHAQCQHAVGKSGEGSSKHERNSQQQNALQPDQAHAAQQVVRRNSAQGAKTHEIG